MSNNNGEWRCPDCERRRRMAAHYREKAALLRAGAADPVQPPEQRRIWVARAAIYDMLAAQAGGIWGDGGTWGDDDEE